MKRFIVFFLSVMLSAVAYSQEYVFYLHGAIVEDQGANAVSPQFGKYEYDNIVSTFRKAGFTVISEVRPRNTEPEAYAHKVVMQVDSLIKKGTKPGKITVIGASKGCLIAIYVSSFLKNKDVNFVFLAGCFSSLSASGSGINFCGNILSVYENSDDIGRSCAGLKNSSALTISHYKEIELHTGLRHGFIYRPLKEWVDPAIKWAHNDYK